MMYPRTVLPSPLQTTAASGMGALQGLLPAMKQGGAGIQPPQAPTPPAVTPPPNALQQSIGMLGALKNNPNAPFSGSLNGVFNPTANGAQWSPQNAAAQGIQSGDLYADPLTKQASQWQQPGMFGYLKGLFG